MAKCEICGKISILWAQCQSLARQDQAPVEAEHPEGDRL